MGDTCAHAQYHWCAFPYLNYHYSCYRSHHHPGHYFADVHATCVGVGVRVGAGAGARMADALVVACNEDNHLL